MYVCGLFNIFCLLQPLIMIMRIHIPVYLITMTMNQIWNLMIQNFNMQQSPVVRVACFV